MSTGSLTRDLRRSVPVPFGNPTLVGSYQTKTWSGANQNPGHRSKSILRWTPAKPIILPRHVVGYTEPPDHWSASRKGRFERRPILSPKEVVGWTRPKPVFGKAPKRSQWDEHAYSVSYRYTEDGLAYCTAPGNYQYVGTSVITIQSVSSQVTSADISRLNGRLREAVAGSQFNPAIFLAEGKQSLDMITNAAARIAKAIKAIKRGRPDQAARAFVNHWPGKDKSLSAWRSRRQTASQQWLELQYGWMPLVEDAYTGAQFLAHQFSMPLQHVVRSRIKVPAYVSTSTQFAFASLNAQTRIAIKAILREVNVPALTGLTNPAAVAWELVPWSFVIDWFIPIGNYLEDRGLAQALKGTFVTSTHTFMEGSGFKDLRPGWTYRSISEGTCYSRSGSFTRSISTSLQVPLPEVVPLNEALSWRRCLNAVALLNGVGRNIQP